VARQEVGPFKALYCPKSNFSEMRAGANREQGEAVGPAVGPMKRPAGCHHHPAGPNPSEEECAMATVTAVAQGRQWQDDWPAVAERATRYFGAIFRGHRDAEDRVQEALCNLMEDFSKRWRPGATFPLQMRFVAVSVLQGLRFFDRKGRGKKLRARSNKMTLLARAKARIARLDAELDFRAAVERLSDYHRRIVLMLVAGYNTVEIHRLVGACHHTVARAIDALKTLL